MSTNPIFLSKSNVGRGYRHYANFFFNFRLVILLGVIQKLRTPIYYSPVILISFDHNIPIILQFGQTECLQIVKISDDQEKFWRNCGSKEKLFYHFQTEHFLTAAGSNSSISFWILIGTPYSISLTLQKLEACAQRNVLVKCFIICYSFYFLQLNISPIWIPHIS